MKPGATRVTRRSLQTRRCTTGALLVAAFASSACSAPRLDDIFPQRARLRGASVVSVGMLGGAGLGAASLEVDEVDGTRWRVPVSIKTGSVGAIMELTTWGSDFDLDLTFADAPTGTELLGTYDGGYGNVSLLVGGMGLKLENEHGVTMAGTSISSGFSINAGHLWLGLEVGGDPVQVEGSPPP
jgi:hypothetical protein